MVKKDSTTTTPTPAPQVKTDAANSIPIIALVLGVVSLLTFMWFLGIAAIILGVIGMRRYKENRGFSIAGLVTGIISTLLMISTVIFFIVMIAIAVTNDDSDTNSDDRGHQYNEQPRREYNDRYYRDDSRSSL
ncbi:DUF4190 domain-containing protein [Candidatus Saccharibacteria bacterium]|nr:DUF4190 domain-containing protein [Candidatus Saccharibacteria bacterium]